MNTTSKKLVIPTDRPINTLMLAIFRSVDSVARALDIGYFVGGAVARDLILMHVFGQNTGRATSDVDLGVCLNDWSLLDKMKNELIQRGDFVASPKVDHRLYYRPEGSRIGIPLDLLPFGNIERPDSTIAWPPKMEMIMTVTGFAEAYAAAIAVEIEPGLFIPVASLPSLAILKLVAWSERHAETQKDATDFFLLLRLYHNAQNHDRLYGYESALLLAADYDPEVAGAMLLGKDATHICLPTTAKFIVDLFSDDRKRQRLVDHMLRSTYPLGNEVTRARAEVYVSSFFQAFNLCG